jgi:hypothetical protein
VIKTQPPCTTQDVRLISCRRSALDYLHFGQRNQPQSEQGRLAEVAAERLLPKMRLGSIAVEEVKN